MNTTRFAPSPTGLLHIGNIRSALLSYLTAKKYGLRFLLRIDDTDRERSKEEYIRYAKEDLNNLGISWDYSFKQSEMGDRYEKTLQACVEAGLVYPVWDSEENVERLRKDLRARRKAPAYKREHAREGEGPRYWRFDLGSTLIEFHDLIVGNMRYDLSSVSDPVICKPNGEFTYTFASIVDDLYEDVSYIIRGADHLTNTSVQLYMARKMHEAGILQMRDINFAHYPLFTDAGHKLSKRLDSLSIRNMHEYHPLALAYYLVTVGTDVHANVMHLDDLAPVLDFEKYSAASLLEFTSSGIFACQHQIFSKSSYSMVRDFLPVDLEKNWDNLRENIVTKNDAQYWHDVLNNERAYFTSIDIAKAPKNHLELRDSLDNSVSKLFARHVLTGRTSGPKLNILCNIIDPKVIDFRLQNYKFKSISITNTLTRSKEDFVPINQAKVKMYACGPTVYDVPHIGNMRSFTLFDIIYRTISFFYHTTYVRNITDIDDKIINRAAEEGLDCKQITQRYVQEFADLNRLLELRTPTHEPFVTKSIDSIIKSIKKLVDNGFAYTKTDGVYFNIGKLEGKYDVFKCATENTDFALWKFREDNGWDSPWGYGRPGWHIECTAMAMDEFALPFDMHLGGRDLIFPHHTNENAQGYGICGQNTANYWLHTNFINLDSAKMSKSLGTGLSLRDLPHHPMIVKIAFIMTNYKQELPWSAQVIQEAQTLYNKWRRALSKHVELAPSYPLSDFLEAMLDDFNTPLALRVLDGAFEGSDIAGIKASFELLGITFDFSFVNNRRIQELVNARVEARQNKNFQLADIIRNELVGLNVELEDSPGSTSWYQWVD